MNIRVGSRDTQGTRRYILPEKIKRTEGGSEWLGRLNERRESNL